MGVLKRIFLSALTLCLVACGGNGGGDGVSSLVRMQQVQDPICQYGATKIDTGLDSNGNGELEDNEVSSTSLICQAQGGVVSAEDFALSTKGRLAGKLDSALIPEPFSNTDLTMQSRSLSMSAITSRKVTDQTGTLWLTPNEISSAIQADQNAIDHAKNNLGSATQIPPPVIEPIEIPVGTDGTYSVDVPAGTDYSLSYVSDDASQAVKIEGINVSPSKTTDVSIAEIDLAQSGSLTLVVQNAANSSPIENASVTLLSDGTSSLSGASGAVAFEGLAPGRYLILIELNGFVSQTVSVQITAGQTLDYGVVNISNVFGSANGLVTVDTGLLTSLDNIIVYARDIDGGIYSTLTDARGAFTFNALPVGAGYSFIVQANDFSANKIDNISVSAGNNVNVGTVELIPSNAFVGAITGFAKFSDKLSLLNAHAGILVAIEGTDKEAVTSRDGAFVLNGLAPGRYSLNFTDSNYQTTTLENIRVVATASTSIDPVELKLKTGRVSGIVSLDGQLSSAGILVEVLGTVSKVYTDNSGRWSMDLPTGNYGNGIRYSADLFESKTITETISVIDNGEYQAEAQVLAQTSKHLTLDLTAVGGNCSLLQVALDGISGAATGYTAFLPVVDNRLEADLLFGDYTLTASCVDTGFETVVKTFNLEPNGGLNIILDPIALRVSYVSINNGAVYTNDVNVDLSIGAVGATQMQVTQGVFDSGWINLQDTYALALEMGDGSKQVVVHLRDSQQQPLSDVASNIILDTTIAVNSFTATGASSKNDILHLRLDLSGETAANVTADIPGLVTGLALFDNGINGDVSANDGIYERNLQITTPNELTVNVTASITDRAGNTASPVATGNVVLSTNPSISAVKVSSNVASGEMTILFTTDEPATSEIYYGTDSQSLSTNLQVAALLTQNHSITLTGLPANQLTHFELVAMDASSNQGTFNGQGKLAPAPTDGLNAAAGSAEVGIVWNASTHSELAGYNVYRSADSGASFNLLNTGQVITERYFVDSLINNEAVYQYYVTVLDKDGNESLPSNIASANPSLSLAGPTQMNGGVIATDTIWLSSRSPYNITDSMLIREDASLLLMAGTEIQFKGANKHILVRGFIDAYGAVDKKVFISSDQSPESIDNLPAIIYANFIESDTLTEYINPKRSDFNYTVISAVKIHSDINSEYSRADRVVNVYFENSELNIVNSMYGKGSDFAIQSAKNSLVHVNSCSDSNLFAAYIRLLDNVVVTIEDGVECSIPTSSIDNNGYALRVGQMLNSSAQDVNLYFNNYISTLPSTLSHVLDRVSFSNGVIYVGSDNQQLLINDSDFSNSQIKLSGGASHLTVHNSRLDSRTTLNADYLDVAGNYWGGTDLEVIGKQSGYFPSPVRGTHLYPIITSADLQNADWDGDGIPDIQDHDNDNDGYSDLQEDWASDPVYGSIFNPLDPNSHPNEAIDSDMDGIADSTDNDDDNDGLSDADEVIYGTNPLLADSDGDGSLDGDEISRKYNPLDRGNFPYIGNVSGITLDSSNTNADGYVYLAGQSMTLSNITVAPGTILLVNKDTNVSFYDSKLIGTQSDPIFIRASGAGSGTTSFNNSQLAFNNIKHSLYFTASEGTTISRSDLLLNDVYIIGNIQDSFLASSFLNLSSQGRFQHSYINNSGSASIDGEVSSTRLANTGYLGLYGEMRNSVANNVHVNTRGKLIDSIALYFSSGNGVGSIIGSDVSLENYTPSEAMAIFFTDSYINQIGTSSFYDGLGFPSDTIGDGVAETVFTMGGNTYTVDGIKNPKSTPNFPNGESDLWSPDGVGCLWDKNDPDTFPNPLRL